MDIPHIQTTSIIFSQQPLYMHYRPLWTMLFITSIPDTPHIHLCFQPTFAYARAEPPKPHHQLICNRHIYHVCESRSQDQPCGSITSETSCGMWWKLRQWRF